MKKLRPARRRSWNAAKDFPAIGKSWARHLARKVLSSTMKSRKMSLKRSSSYIEAKDLRAIEWSWAHLKSPARSFSMKTSGTHLNQLSSLNAEKDFHAFALTLESHVTQARRRRSHHRKSKSQARSYTSEKWNVGNQIARKRSTRGRLWWKRWSERSFARNWTLHQLLLIVLKQRTKLPPLQTPQALQCIIAWSVTTVAWIQLLEFVTNAIYPPTSTSARTVKQVCHIHIHSSRYGTLRPSQTHITSAHRTV